MDALTRKISISDVIRQAVTFDFKNSSEQIMDADSLRSFLEREIPTATADGLILLKLYALPSLYREGNFNRVGIYENDIAALLFAVQPDTDALLSAVSAYLDPNDRQKVQTILAEIQQRIQRFRNSSNTPSNQPKL
jgi:hypothetical protein